MILEGLTVSKPSNVDIKDSKLLRVSLVVTKAVIIPREVEVCSFSMTEVSVLRSV